MATTLKYSEVRAWLEAQPENTASNPYELIITGIAKSNFSLNFSGRYVAIAGLEMQSGETELGPIFFGCPTLVGSVTIPEGVTVIGQRAFAGCGITNVNIPNSVTTLVGDAFWDCQGLASVNIPDSVKIIGMGAFRNCRNLTSVAIPDGATNVHYDAFFGCTKLQYTDTYYLPTKSGGTFLCKKIPADATSFNVRGDCVGISSESFWKCQSLASVSIPNSVKTIGENAFKECTSLTSVTIPGSVTFMGNHAFEGCTGLTTVNLNSGVTYISDYAFLDCTKLTVINCNNGTLTSIGVSAFGGCTSIPFFAIPESVKTIGDAVFQGCTSLASVTIPNSITTISNGAFQFCSSLANINTPEMLITIGAAAFQGCTSLGLFYIPNNVKIIGSSAFLSCTSLGTVYMFPAFSSTLMASDSFLGTPSTLNLYVLGRNLSGWKSVTLTNYGFASGVVAKMMPSRKWVRNA